MCHVRASAIRRNVAVGIAIRSHTTGGAAADSRVSVRVSIVAMLPEP